MFFFKSRRNVFRKGVKMHANKLYQSIIFVLFVTISLVFNLPETNGQVRQKSKKNVSVKKSKTAKKTKKNREREEDERPIVIVRNGKKYVLSKDRDLERFDQPAEATEWFLKKRLPKGMKELPIERYFAAQEKIKEMPRYSSSDGKLYPSEKDAPNLKEGTSNKDKSGTDTNSAGETSGVLGTWKALGPGNVGGRTRALLIDPTNPLIIYAGAVDGGIWKSTDGGTSWNPLDDFLANIAVTCLAFDPTNSNTIYAGTGEGFFNADGVRGAGIFKSTDAGATWTRLSFTASNSDFYYVYDLVVSPADAQHLYAATRTGVHRSLDGGANWTKVLDATAINGATDLVMRTDATGQTSDYIYAALGTFATGGIYRNTDAGGSGTWTNVYSETGMGRTSLALAPSNQNIIYALSASIASGNFNNGLLAVFRSTSSGDTGTWTARVRNTDAVQLNRLLLSNPVYNYPVCVGSTNYLNQGWYDNVIAVDPTDPDIVWTGGIDLMRSNDGGQNWGLASYWYYPTTDANYAHADNHAIVFHPQYNGTTNKTMFVGSDGGIFRTNDAQALTSTDPCPTVSNPPNSIAWTNLNNGYQVTQFNHGLPYPNGTTYFGGTQDNGTIRGTDGGGTNGWTRVAGGDGGYVAVDPTNTNTIYTEFTGLSIQKSTNGGTTFSNAFSGISGDTFPFYTVFQMDPSNSQRLWIGGTRMWRTTNGATSWTSASTAITSGSITAIAIAPTNANRVMAGAASSRIANTTIGLTSTSTTGWTLVFSPRGNGGGVISWIAFDPTNELIAYATCSTFNGATSGHIFKTTDGGATWNSIDGSGATALPDIPAHSVVVDPNDTQRLYVGTDLGVFVTLDGGANWARETTGFSNVVVESLSLLNNNGVTSLFAFTHGRGAYKVTVPATCSTVSPTTQMVAGLGGAASVTVTKNPSATATCDWNAVSNSNFITITGVTRPESKPTQSDVSGVDTQTVNFQVEPNFTGSARTGTLTVAGRTVTINQPMAPVAAGVTVSGKVMTPQGSGIKQAIITLTDSRGNIKTATTSSFGNFQFDDVSVGETYVLSVRARSYTFQTPTQILTVNDNVSNINFISQ